MMIDAQDSQFGLGNPVRSIKNSGRLFPSNLASVFTHNSDRIWTRLLLCYTVALLLGGLDQNVDKKQRIHKKGDK